MGEIQDEGLERFGHNYLSVRLVFMVVPHEYVVVFRLDLAFSDESGREERVENVFSALGESDLCLCRWDRHMEFSTIDGSGGAELVELVLVVHEFFFVFLFFIFLH